MPSTPDDDGFLSRWSRRKREVEAESKAMAPVEPAPQEPLPVEAAEAEPAPEMVEPPSLESVDKDFDLAHWLKQNVPESWKLAALRRVWETDPAIRDFVNPAREYALDWNTPGGAPGYGPLTESDDVKAMLAQLFPEPPKTGMPNGQVAESAQESGDEQIKLSSNYDGGEGSLVNDAAAQQAQVSEFTSEKREIAQISAIRRSDGPFAALNDENMNAATHKAIEAVPAEAARPTSSRRRGGGAMPI
ncbi:MAG: DUF3306 domain-containing protein [Bosea sp. (in: a-proteobacteria)]